MTINEFYAEFDAFRTASLNKFNVLDGKIDFLVDAIKNLDLGFRPMCTMCHGAGQITPSHNLNQSPPAPITCPSCNGAGSVRTGWVREPD